MGAVIQRTHTCLTCGGPMPTVGRVDRRYCKGACRTLAYRVRRRIKATRPPGPLEPEWSQPSAVVKTMLTSLAQIQARVLDFAHQLEHEELYARPPVRTEPQPAAAGAAEPMTPSPTHKTPWANHQIPLFDESGGGAAREEGQAGAIPVAAASSAPPRPHAAHSADSAAPSSDVRLQARLDEVLRQRDALQADLLAERERTGRLDTQLRNLQREANEAVGRLKEQQSRLQRDNEGLTLRVRDQQMQLQRASETLATWEQAGSESQTMAAHSHALTHENELLHAELRRLRPPSADADPLLRLMIDRVKALHWLAVYQTRSGENMTGELLPSYDSEQILAAAQRHAFAARRDHYFSAHGPYAPKPSWVKEDQLLDDRSEKKVYDEAEFKNKLLLSSVQFARWRAGDKP